jgi:DNA (cytosine-5)-methyltransferase 1
MDRMNSRRQAISLFSGCGGDTLGLERAGFKVIAYNEFNKAAAKTHEANFPESKGIIEPKSKSSDIKNVPDEEFAKYAGQADVVFAGFPCQGFSRAGKKQSTDPRNQMFRQFVRVVKQVRPRFFIGENVVGLTSMKSGPNEDDPLMLDIIRGAFREIGYEMTYQVLEAVNFGVPQKRKRILLVGWDITRVTNMEPASFWASVNAFGATKTMPTLRSFVTNSMEGAFRLAPASIPEGFEDYALAVPQDAEATGVPHPFIVLKAGENLLSCTKRDSPIHSEIVNLDAPSKTIICTYDHQPRLLVGLKKPDGTAYARCLLPDELKQIQAFPADFKLEGNKKEQVVQVGNAVPPVLVESVASGIAKLLAPKIRIKNIVVKNVL